MLNMEPLLLGKAGFKGILPVVQSMRLFRSKLHNYNICGCTRASTHARTCTPRRSYMYAPGRLP